MRGPHRVRPAQEHERDAGLSQRHGHDDRARKRSPVNVVDSSGWLEYFADSAHAGLFARAIEKPGKLIVPTISIYEVCKKVRRERGREAAMQAFGLMNRGEVVDLDAGLALEATRHSLPLADGIIYATALRCQATLWTLDAHFKGLPGVRYFPK